MEVNELILQKKKRYISEIRAIRHAAGMFKHKLLYSWPYKGMQAKAAKLREQLYPMISNLPPIEATAKPEVEIHMLCGKSHLDMAIWASWSFMRFLKNSMLYIHSDGTLEDSDIALLQKIICPSVIVTKSEADACVAAKLFKLAPRLCQFRDTNLFASQITSMQLYGNLDRFLMLDADVLCFSDPCELRAALMADKPAFRWGSDLRTAYVASVSKLKEITQLQIPEGLNLGNMVTPRMNEEDFRYLEELIPSLQADPDVDMECSWAPQTLLAIIAGRYHQTRPLSRDYAVSLGRTSDNAIVRHYISIPATRPRFFLEGIPKLLKNL
ncbi:MAG: hypothetical protein JW806_07405 [Sedimentisphaerales bacterium]|nr:hypothetical protein [Sedimentisphaerales bacterium]